MANGQETNKSAGVFRTRKAEIISGISVVTLIAIFSFVRNVVHDFHAALEAQARVIEKRIERVECALDKDIERVDKKTDKIEVELKQRIVWIEREINRTSKIRDFIQEELPRSL